MNRTWIADAHPFAIAQYVRVSPIGPMLPIVFTPSTLGDDLNFGLTWRDAIVSEATANQIADEFIERLVALADETAVQFTPAASAPEPRPRLARGA